MPARRPTSETTKPRRPSTTRRPPIVTTAKSLGLRRSVSCAPGGSAPRTLSSRTRIHSNAGAGSAREAFPSSAPHRSSAGARAGRTLSRSGLILSTAVMKPVLGSVGGMEVVCALGCSGSFFGSGEAGGGRDTATGGPGSFAASPFTSVLGSEGGGRGRGGRGRRLTTFSALRGRTSVGRPLLGTFEPVFPGAGVPGAADSSLPSFSSLTDLLGGHPDCDGCLPRGTGI